MLWIEMSRDEVHGGGAWGFTRALWSPSHKNTSDGKRGGTWPWWENVLKVRQGDTIYHLRGEGHKAQFVGFSLAETDGFVTKERPPQPGIWDYATSYYKVQLREFTPLPSPIPLYEGFFVPQEQQLRAYCEHNRKLPATNRRRPFFVVQSGRVQCLNGAYLSEADDTILKLLLGSAESMTTSRSEARTAEVIRLIKSRLGQQAFSRNVRANYGAKCCFPQCIVSDSHFLIASHIARWADNEEARGKISNGLCLCLMHDKAFELGLFTLNYNLEISLTPEGRRVGWSQMSISPYEGHKISLPHGAEPPSPESLESHWSRIGFEPPAS